MKKVAVICFSFALAIPAGSLFAQQAGSAQKPVQVAQAQAGGAAGAGAGAGAATAAAAGAITTTMVVVAAAVVAAAIAVQSANEEAPLQPTATATK